ncbi:UNVERIFIED_CONTAM: hypothetical protein FKN15_063022 [Acipenser sinensis]
MDLLFQRGRYTFTEEKLGQAEKTELDAHFENLLARADSTKNWTEKIFRQTEVLLQPNPSARIEEFLYEKLDRKLPSRTTNGELLGQYMLEAANEFGPGTPYGAESSELVTGGEFNCTLPSSLRFPNTFVNTNPTPVPGGSSPSSAATLPVQPSSSPLDTGTLSIEEVQPPATGTRKAKVLYDYDAADTSELSLLADELITVYTVPGMDPDWLVGERGNQKGKVPVTYLELLS